MMSDSELEQYLDKLQIPASGKEYIKRQRCAPARMTQSNGTNVVGRYCSRKMKCTIQFESRTIELAILQRFEDDEDVLEYYDQPSQIQLVYKHGEDNRTVSFRTHPDFLVLRNDSVQLIECKPHEKLMELRDRSPNRLTLANNTWKCPPAEEYCKELGIKFEIISDRDIDWVLSNNFNFLRDYFYNQIEDVDPKWEEIKNAVETNPGILLYDLIAQFDVDAIYFMISRKEIYVDLYKELLSQGQFVHVFSNVHIANAFNIAEQAKKYNIQDIRFEFAPGARIIWNEIIYEIINIGETEIVLQNIQNKSLISMLNNEFYVLFTKEKFSKPISTNNNSILTDILSKATKKALEEGNKRFQVIKPYLHGEKDKSELGFPLRTINRWIKAYMESELSYGNGYVGLLSKSQYRGNRTRKIDDTSLDLMRQYIYQDFDTFIQKQRSLVHTQYRAECLKKGLSPASYKTFCSEIKATRTQYHHSLTRQGKRAAYKYEPEFWHLELTTPVHGDRPFYIAHIDHTELDIELIDSATGQNLGRPWLTILMDAYSRRVLAFHITYNKPSVLSCRAVLLECVRKFNRIPEYIVCDGGAEFQSVYYEATLAFLRVHKLQRPPTKARFGSVIERLFGTINKQFIHNIVGNTQITKNVRQVYIGNNPKNLTVWTIADISAILKEWAYKVYDCKTHQSLGISPREQHTLGMNYGGMRKFNLIPYDESFLIMTMPSTPNGEAIVQPGKGVRIQYINYYCKFMSDPKVEGKKVKVKYDPDDRGVAYAYIQGEWRKCHSSFYNVFHNRTQSEVEFASKELKQRMELQKNKKSIDDYMLAKFFDKVESLQENKKIQLTKLRENKKTLLDQDKLTQNENQNIQEEKSLSNLVELKTIRDLDGEYY